jgi:hypothetical protein
MRMSMESIESKEEAVVEMNEMNYRCYLRVHLRSK